MNLPGGVDREIRGERARGERRDKGKIGHVRPVPNAPGRRLAQVFGVRLVELAAAAPDASGEAARVSLPAYGRAQLLVASRRPELHPPVPGLLCVPERW
jgi:hypothetical protein